jgi:hypothetical protein
VGTFAGAHWILSHGAGHTPAPTTRQPAAFRRATRAPNPWDPSDQNAYIYVQNNPTRYIDHSGRDGGDEVGGFEGAGEWGGPGLDNPAGDLQGDAASDEQDNQYVPTNRDRQVDKLPKTGVGAYPRIPGWARMLGVDENELGKAIEDLKGGRGLGGSQNVDELDRDGTANYHGEDLGNVYDTGEIRTPRPSSGSGGWGAGGTDNQDNTPPPCAGTGDC